MRKIFTILATVLITAGVYSQSPEKMSYQAVIRNSSDQLITDQGVFMQISILQGSADGTPVYVETHAVYTNANGLVSVEIGGGTISEGSFASIDWEEGPHFVKTETDPTGGTNYTIIGTSQLLSVPYALHAKTAETITGTITETDPVFNEWDKSTGISIRESQISDLQSYLTSEVDGSVTNELQALTISNDTIYLSNGGFVKLPTTETTAETDPVFSAWDKDYEDLINTPAEPDGSETNVTAGTNITITGDGTTASPYVVNEKTLTIGQSYQGGIIFWLDETGQHGLIAATSDQGDVRWYNGTHKYIGSSGDGIYAGAMNTAIIIASQMADDQTGSFAAKVCADYSVTVNGVIYGDWYLPSKYELNLLTKQKDVIDGFENATYWSSTEDYIENAWTQFSEIVRRQDVCNKFFPCNVRAIRAF